MPAGMDHAGPQRTESPKFDYGDSMFNISNQLHGRWCRYIIHRYLGHLLDKDLSLEQLSIDLSKGCIEIKQVSLNVQYINEQMAALNLPLRLIDGFIGSIRIIVPWASLMADASEVDLSDVQLTFRGIESFKLDDGDLVSSMLGSIVGSLKSSIEVAQEFRQEQRDEGQWSEGRDEESVNALGKVVDALVSRFCCNINDLILRVESDPPSGSDIASAVEFRIAKLRFEDEQMKQCKQEGTSAETITSQPHGLSSETDMNKHIIMDGVSLYTDVFSTADLQVSNSSGSPVSSMSLRREHRKSCNPTTSISAQTINDSIRTEPTLPSNPVKFAEIAGETTIVIRVKKSEESLNESSNNKFEFDICSKSINILITPSQIELIKNLTGMLIPIDERVSKEGLGGVPMKSGDFVIVNRLMEEMTTEHRQRGGNALGNTDNTVMANIKIGSILACITHEDPLSIERVAEMEGGVREAVELLNNNAERFFESAAELRSFRTMESMQKVTHGLYSGDHIRLIGSTLSVSYSSDCAPDNGIRVSTKLSVANCDISEYLTVESTTSLEPRQNPLLTFERDDGDQGSQFTVAMRQEKGDTSTVVTLGKCRSELDVSMIDRISHLLSPRPFFVQRTGGYENDLAPYGLSEHLCSEKVSTSTIEVNCASWSIDLRIPKIDLREGVEDRIAHSVQNVHEESLRLKLTSCKVLLPSKTSNGPQTVEITASKITGHFIGDIDKLGCSEEDTAFLYAGSKGGQAVRITLELDGSDKSLKSGVIGMTVDDMTKSISADLLRNRPKKAGPFAQTHQSFTKINATKEDDEDIIRAGSREEMATFARDCLEQADVTLKIDVPILRLLIPDHQFLELLYNRLANGLALWKPSAAAFDARNSSLNINLDDELFKEVTTAMSSGRMDIDYDDELDDCWRNERDRTNMKGHLFALQLDVKTGTIVMGTKVVPASNEDAPQPAQVVTELAGTQMFVCSGYQGDANQTFVHLTTTSVTLAQRSDSTIPMNVLNHDFGSYEQSEVQLCSLPSHSHLREGRSDDSLGVALHVVTSEDGRVKETTAAIALRLLELNLIPVKRMEEWWAMQLKDLFCLTDVEIPGYVMPVCNTYLHINLDNAVISHNHNIIVEGSPIKYKLLLGNVDINSTLVPTMKVNKFHCLFEQVHLHMSKDEIDSRAVRFADAPRTKQGSNMVHILEVGFFELELLLFNQLMVREGEQRNCPMFELRCQNDQIKAWVCHDSLATLINTIVDVAQSDLWKTDEPASEQECVFSPNSECLLTSLIEAACEDVPVLATRKTTKDVSYDSNLLDDAMRDVSDESISDDRSPSFSEDDDDDDFFMVEAIPGCGITSASGEPRIKLIDPDNTAESGDYFFNYCPEHITTTGDFRDDAKILANQSVPLIKCNLKDISIELHIFGGNDLGSSPDAAKSYSADEYKHGSGRGQSVAAEARGGPHRDHSVSVVVELAKISYLHQIFDKESSMRSMNFLSVQNVTVQDRLTLSNIKEMLYQYATIGQPRRTCAPMIAIRMVDDHSQEGKLRISMLPIKLNIDQDTLEFLEDFVQAVNTGLALPETSKLTATNHTEFEVPQSPSPSVAYRRGDDDVSMEGSVYGETLGERLEDDEDADDVEARSSSCRVPSSASEEKISEQTFFKEFVFSPECTIYIDYQGKNKINMEKAGAVLGVLRGIGQLNRTEISLKSFEYRNGLLGLSKCAEHAITEWQESITASLPGALGSVGPISPLVQIGKGICDFLWLPVSEMRKDDGSVVKGLQRGTSSFGFSTVAAIVDLAQKLVGAVQVTAESVLYEMTPDHPSLNNRNRRPITQAVQTPQDVKHGMQLAYDLIANGVQQTREDLELATQEDRASGRSSMRSVLRYASPAILRPFVITSQIGYQLLGGLKNQLRPDQFRDEQHKWRNESERAGTGGNN